MTSRRLSPTAGAVRLHFNENTAGCSPAVLAALRAMTREDAAMYPEYERITARCERWFDVAPGWVQLTNGLDEGLQVAALWAARAAPRALAVDAIVIEPAFEVYRACIEAAGADVIHIDPGSDFAFPIGRVLDAISPNTRLIYLADPNNPTGLGLPIGTADVIANAAPHALVVVDEAYADFSGRTIIGDALDRHRNLVVGRTFAKAHGLAGIRIGALVGHPDTLDGLRRLLLPYSVNASAVVSLAAALDDRAYLDWSVSQSAASRELIYAAAARHDLRYWRSEANFVLVQLGESAAVIAAALAARGILIRDKSAAPGCAGCVRITAGVVEHTELAIQELEDILASRAR
ncbi:MAG: histidinol-phosphate transaminase [Acidobacteriota bacterium]